ncbi:hypothetical protein TREVI0001_2312 [Treponema vincentii ATCC 35580]|jgi:hypothetical protein|uniref:Uncharacterized protein n=1 Tax=Treponema vincentii ATCC 35580 TaxID=596324 RepID=C8PM10_9SPIR|nr:hypothetical protein TREVI0001_2312 [Treponema vincentii ATCC 35580]
MARTVLETLIKNFLAFTFGLTGKTFLKESFNIVYHISEKQNGDSL